MFGQPKDVDSNGDDLGVYYYKWGTLDLMDLEDGSYVYNIAINKSNAPISVDGFKVGKKCV